MAFIEDLINVTDFYVPGWDYLKFTRENGKIKIDFGRDDSYISLPNLNTEKEKTEEYVMWMECAGGIYGHMDFVFRVTGEYDGRITDERMKEYFEQVKMEITGDPNIELVADQWNEREKQKREERRQYWMDRINCKKDMSVDIQSDAAQGGE